MKCLLMASKTNRGKIVRRYFIKTESLAKLMFRLLSEIKQKETERIKNELELTKKKTLQLTNRI